MAKENKSKANKVNGDFDLDEVLDLGDLDFGSPFTKDDRKPIIKAASGVAKGIKKLPRDGAFLKSTLKTALPRGYGSSWDEADKVTSSLRNLYDESAKELKPAIRESKKAISKLIPRESKLVPKGITKMLDKWDEEEKEASRGRYESAFQQRENGISQQMADIFRAQTQMQVDAAAQIEGRDRLKEGIELTRHREVSELMMRSTISLDKIQKYQSTVTLGYQKKSLELQFRNLFALQDMLVHLKEDSVKRDTLLLAISKNTTLPDSVKINSKEAKEALARQSFNQSVHKGLFGGRDEIIEKTLARFSKGVMDNVKGVAQGLSMGASVVDGGGGFEGDKYSMGGEFAGGFIGNQIGSWAAGKAKDALKSGKFDRFGGKKILKGGGWLKNMNANIAQRAHAFKNDSKYLFDNSIKGKALQFLQTLMPNMLPDTRIMQHSAKSMEEPVGFTRRTDRAITEVIPGYLSRILREVQVTRTGNPKIELTTYSYAAGKFTSKSKGEQIALREIINKEGAQRTARHMDRVIREIDPDEKLTPAQKAELKKILLTNSVNLKEANHANLGNRGNYSAQHGPALSAHMSKYLSGLSDDERAAFSNLANDAASTISDSREAIQREANNGNVAFLKRNGLLSADGKNIDMNKMIEMVLDPKNHGNDILPNDPVKQKMFLDELAEKALAAGQKVMNKGKAAVGKGFKKGKKAAMSGVNAARNMTKEDVANAAEHYSTVAKYHASTAMTTVSKKYGELREMTPEDFVKASKQFKVTAGKAVSNAVNDVYVAGEASPRITAAKLKLGVYRDRVTKKVIRHLEDIKGPVEDVSEKFQVVLQNEDLKKLVQLTDNGVQQVKTVANAAQDKTALGLANMPTTGKDLASMVLEKGQSAMDEVKALADVYVEGEKTPRMIVAKMVQGLYTDSETGEPIRHQTDIKGVVKDEEGKDVIGADDIPKLRIWNHRSKRFVPFLGGVAWIMKKMWNFQVKMTKMSMRNLGRLWAATKAVGRGVKWMLGYGPKKPKDVYVIGEPEPRLYAARFAAGDYRDKESNERVYHHDDITGPVVDRENTTVLFQEDIDRLQVYDNVLKVFNPLKLVKWVFKKAGQLIGSAAKTWQTKIAPAITKRALSALGSVSKAAYRSLVGAKDLYVKGSNKIYLRAVEMESGGYISKKTRKFIRSAVDIDGAVLSTATGNEVLSDDEFARGLELIDGTPAIKGVVAKVAKGLKALNKMMSIRVKLPTKQREQSTASILKDKAATSGDKTVVLLQDIKAIFEKRFGSGDVDGDGFRDGSWQQKAKEKVSETIDTVREKTMGKGKGGKGLLSRLAGRLPKGMGGGSLGGESLVARGAGMAAGAEGLGAAAGAAEGGAAALGGLGGMGTAAVAIAGVIAAMVAGNQVNKVLGKVGVGKDAKLDSSQDDNNWGNMSGTEKFESGLSRGLEKTARFFFMDNLADSAASSRQASETEYMQKKASGTNGFLDKPILDFLAMGVPGLNIYNALSGGPKTTAYDQLRYVQYGFSPDNKDAQEKASKTEDYIQSLTSNDLKINEEKIDASKIMDFWGLSSKDKSLQQKFFGWYKERFKPVFLVHLAAVKKYTGKMDLKAVPSLKKEDQYAYVQAIRFSDGPYSWRGLPQSGNEWQPTGPASVMSAVEKAIRDLGAKPSEKKEGEISAETEKANSKEEGGEKIVGEEDKSFISKWFSSDTKKSPEAIASTSGVGKEAFATRKGVSGLQAVRFKVYGLRDMDAFKVNSLVMLENTLRPGVKFGGDGKSTWDGDMGEVFTKTQTYFGIAKAEGQAASEWKVWFKNRFLPAFLAYAASVQNLTGKAGGSDDGALKPSDKVTIAKMLVGISGIWRQKESPWPDYRVGTDDSVTNENITGLQAKAKEAKLLEEKAAASSGDKAQEKSMWDKTKDTVSGWFGSKPTTGKDLGDSKVTSPDAESQSKGQGGGVSPVAAGGGSTGPTPALAGGVMFDGRNAMASMILKPGVTLEGMHPEFMKNFGGMVEEYNKLTGKKVSINDAFRSFQKQAEMKAKYGSRAASPGNSLHEFGLAMDIDTQTLDELDKMGLMRKYGFTRPVGGEGWHMEPIGIQQDIGAYKANKDAAAKAIASGVGRGGGGFGTMPGATKYGRNNALAMAIYSNASTPNVDNSKEAKSSLEQPNVPGQAGTGQPKAYSQAADSQTANSAVGSSANSGSSMGNAMGVADGEAKPATGGAGTSPAGQAGTSSGLAPKQPMLADPSVKVPDPKGPGYAGMKDTIEAAAKMVGVDSDTLVRMAAIESGFNASAKAGNSSASGLFQFTSDTWRAMIDKYGRKYGYTAQTPTSDPKASAIMAAHMLKESQKFVTGKVKKEFGPTEAYMTHFLGAGGAVTFLKALEANPQAFAAKVMPDAAKANVSIFYDNGRPRTLQEVYALLDNKVNAKLSQFGIPNIRKNNQAMASSSGATSTDAGSSSAPAMPSAPTADASAVSSAMPSQQTPDAQAQSVNDAYGFKSADSINRLQPTGQPEQASANVMKPTEDILSQQLDVQRQMLTQLSQLVQMGGLKAQSVAPSADPSAGDKRGDTYTPPKAPVSMNRVVV